ncbi:hypothetical protein PYR66_06750 [Klebsiella aerogenes]|nr:hypothetical protein PYR66_06750 [Klebsiella aerogenes]
MDYGLVYLYSDDIYYSSGIQVFCEKRGFGFILINKNNSSFLEGLKLKHNDIFIFDVDGVAFEQYERVLNYLDSVCCVLLTLDVNPMHKLHSRNSSKDYYLSKKSDFKSVGLWLSKNKIVKRVCFTHQEMFLIKQLFNGESVHDLARKVQINYKTIYTKRQRALEKCGFSRWTAKTGFFCAYLQHMHRVST